MRPSRRPAKGSTKRQPKHFLPPPPPRRGPLFPTCPAILSSPTPPYGASSPPPSPIAYPPPSHSDTCATGSVAGVNKGTWTGGRRRPTAADRPIASEPCRRTRLAGPWPGTPARPRRPRTQGASRGRRKPCIAATRRRPRGEGGRARTSAKAAAAQANGDASKHTSADIMPLPLPPPLPRPATCPIPFAFFPSALLPSFPPSLPPLPSSGPSQNSLPPSQPNRARTHDLKWLRRLLRIAFPLRPFSPNMFPFAFFLSPPLLSVCLFRHRCRIRWRACEMSPECAARFVKTYFVPPFGPFALPSFLRTGFPSSPQRSTLV